MLLSQNTINAETVVCIAATLAASTMIIRSLTSTNDIVPFGIRCLLKSNLRKLKCHLSSQRTLVIEQFEEYYLDSLYMAVEKYLGDKFSFSVQRVKVSKNEKEIKPVGTIDTEEEICDVFEEAAVRWKLVYRENIGQVAVATSSLRSYELTFHKKHKEKVLNSYLPYILQHYAKAMEENKVRKLHSLCCSHWRTAIPLNHPMTFDTIAMDSELKQAVLDDLNTFMNGKEHYRRIGKAWKRGYLLYGPAGSGKSSLIAAMANHLNCSIHDLDLTDYSDSYEIRALLHHYLDRTILVVRDVESIFKVRNRYDDEHESEVQKQDLLLKLLKHIDGLWMSRRTEMIIVATTTHKDMIGSALLSRLDMEIHMPYCTICVLKQLVQNYFCSNIDVPEELQELLKVVKVTTGEVIAELSKTSSPEFFFQRLSDFLCRKQSELEGNRIGKGKRKLKQHFGKHKKR